MSKILAENSEVPKDEEITETLYRVERICSELAPSGLSLRVRTSPLSNRDFPKSVFLSIETEVGGKITTIPLTLGYLRTARSAPISGGAAAAVFVTQPPSDSEIRATIQSGLASISKERVVGPIGRIKQVVASLMD